ncbi:MAG: YybH family protein [Rubripirellula sp.]
MRTVLFRSFFSIAVVTALPLLADEVAVKKMVSDYADAFNNKNIESVTNFWTPEGLHIDRETGERTEGRDAILDDIRESFSSAPDAKIQGRIDVLRLIRPDVASVEGRVTVSAPGVDPAETDFSAILVSSDGKWMIERIEERPVPAPSTSYDALRELEWLVGSWRDDGNSMRIDNVFRWSDNGAFLIRSFGMQADDGSSQSGTQVIGWDPRSQEIRSWSFNSDGSFGDAVWSKSGKDWLVKSSQTLSDGVAASGTFVLAREGEDRLSIRLMGHEVEGEPQPAEGSVTVTRVVESSVDATEPTSAESPSGEAPVADPAQ